MGNNRVPGAACLAIEATRAALAQTTSPVDLTGTWLYFDWKLTDYPGYTLVTLSIRISGVGKVVEVTCDSRHVGTGEMGCYILLDSSTGLNWQYRCILQGDNRFQVQATSTI
jgi:hypothetical protein